MKSFQPNALVHSGKVRTTCPYCGVGCGVLAEVDTEKDGEFQALNIQGDPQHPSNLGKLCVKGTALGETVITTDRMAYPSIDNERVDWNTALDQVAHRLKNCIEQYGPESVAFYISGQLLTEDYYVVNKLVKGYIGTANIDTNSRLCMSSAVAGHKRAFGTDTVSNVYDDIEAADVLVLVGANMAWCHPILYNRIKAEKKHRPNLKVLIIDPRATASNELADLHLAIHPGKDVLLFNALLVHLWQEGHTDQSFLEAHVDGFSEALKKAQVDINTGDVVERLGIAERDWHCFLDTFSSHQKVLTMFSMGVNQSAFGTDKVNAIINCHLATGRIGQAGMGPFSLTGQPNAMGGREVGGLSNTLAAHLEIHEPSHRTLVQTFWQSPKMAQKPGLKAIDLFEAVANGSIQFLWIMGTNPVVSMPNANRVKEALASCPNLVVSEVMDQTDCTLLAQVKLPAMGWSEKDGTVTNSERRISRQRAVLPAFRESAPDWWMVAQVAQRMGFSGFEYSHPHEIFIEHAALSGHQNNEAGIRRDFDISGLANLSFQGYQDLEPIQWPYAQSQLKPPTRFFAQGDFYTSNRRAKMVPVSHQLSTHQVNRDYPFVLNTGRIRDQWHTMTRTGLTARLTQHISEPYAELHPRDAMALKVEEGELLAIHSKWGMAQAKVWIKPEQKEGSVFMPIHWNGLNSTVCRVGVVVGTDCDKISGQHQGKLTPVALRKVEVKKWGFVLTEGRQPLLTQSPNYAVNIRVDAGFRQELAWSNHEPELNKFIQLLLNELRLPVDCEYIEYQDEAQGVWRAAWVVDQKLKMVTAFANDPFNLPMRTWLDTLINQPLNTQSRRQILSGCPASLESDKGSIVCSCYGIGSKTIERAIQEMTLKNVHQVGEMTKAGTNCGSCQSDIQKILKHVNDKA